MHNSKSCTLTLAALFTALFTACVTDDPIPDTGFGSSLDATGEAGEMDTDGSEAGTTTDTEGTGNGDTSSGPDSGDDSTGGDDTGSETGGDGDTDDDDGGVPEDGPIALFAINEGNFNGDVDEGIWSIMTSCASPSFDAYLAKVAEFPELDDAKHFVTGWSCGATYALIRGYEHSDFFRGIVHLNQASTSYAEALDTAFANGGNVRVPVFLIHDFSYDAGGQLTMQWFESKGYQEGVDLFIMDRPGTGHEPYLTDDEKDVVAGWFQDM